MRTTNPFRKAAAPGVGLLAAATLTISALGAVPAASSAASAAQSGSSSVDTQAAGDGTEFPGYNGVVDPAKSASLAASGAKDTKKKPADPTLGDPSESRGQDVPGVDAASQPDSAQAFQLPSAPDATRVAEVTDAAQRGRSRPGDRDDRHHGPARGRARQVRPPGPARRHRDSLADLRSDLAGTGTRTIESSPPPRPPSTPSPTTGSTCCSTTRTSSRSSSTARSSPRSPRAPASSTPTCSTRPASSATTSTATPAAPTRSRSSTPVSTTSTTRSPAGSSRQACYVTDSSCLGGVNASTAAGSGDECTHSTDCDHGTHVGGIAAGSTFTGGHEGVARGAGIVAIKVAQDNPTTSRWTAFFSSIDSALSRVLTSRPAPTRTSRR